MKDERTNARKECEILVQNIAQSHARLAPSIQVAIENQWDNDFSECLRAFAAEKEEEIRDVCSSHYQEFVQSIEDIVQIKCDVNDLQVHIDKYNKELVDATAPLVQGNDMLAACREIRRNIDTSIERLQQCQRIVECTTKVDKYIQANQLYHALKVLETIKADISTFRGNRFAKRVNNWIAATMTHLREYTTRRTSLWLEDIRNAASSIGAQAMKRGEESTATLPLSHLADSDSTLHLPSLEALSLHAKDIRTKNALHADYCQQALALLAPMLRTLHVYKYLHTTSELAKFYNTNRMPQLQFSAFLSGDIGTISAEKFAAQHDEMFKRIVGTFCMEKLLAVYSNESLLSKKEVNAACLSVLQSLSGLMMALTLKLQSPKLIVDIKRNAALCARVLGDDIHQFNTSIVLDAFRGMGDFYRKKCRVDMKVKLREFLLQDTFQKVQATKSNYIAYLHLCGLDKQGDDFLRTADSKGNIYLPFTAVVRRSCEAIHEMIDMMFEFERHLNIADWGYFVREDTCEALIELNVVLNELIENHTDLQISQAVITGANSSYLSSACNVFAAVLQEKIDLWEMRALTAQTAKGQQPSAAGSRPTFTIAMAKKRLESTSTRAQDMVCEIMVKKIDDLIASFYFLEWLPTDPTKQADPCMSDLINYLQASFTQLSTLPLPIKDAVHFASCIHINKALEQVLVGPTVKKMNLTGMLNFKRNLDALVQYAGTCGVGQLKDCFLPMTQLVDLIVSDDLERLDQTTFKSGGKYTHVMPDHVAAVVEKFKETAVSTASSSSMFFKSSKSKAETTVGLKRSVVDAVLRQLKTIGPMHK
ncbi:hypothetical protein H310_04895 [Aphanomyces invadans]|uniref:Exocyst complex component n=1 Tax=Aphanomyces invadans TaxID=157072 RepID=A0A024UAL4_9STRA|nr:hypothetical protein H310_04895 [Aphanomyces invadans]ETW03431.1 hypothetical protein H310_04895 [Aphanomyces invadans]|eukprot:XP_008867660.1 hypothetical protein H310_04895 [Aphanomyces invadans]